MAGIGFKLDRMVRRDSLSGSLGAMLTGVAVTSGPWLLTTALLVMMRISAVAAGIEEVTSAERVITVVYALAIVLSTPIDIVLTRFAADCVYQGKCERIAAPLCRALAGVLVGFTCIGALAMFVLDVPAALAVPGTVLAAIVGAQWLLLSAAGGLSSPGIILKAFGYGAPVSIAAWLLLSGPLQIGPTGYLLGFAAGQVVTLAFLLHGTLRALPRRIDRSARLRDSYRTHMTLALETFAFNAGLWVDKLVVFLICDGHTASQYAALAAVAWLSIVPAMAYLYVSIETVFHSKFRAFYASVSSGASLSELERLAHRLQMQVKHTLRKTCWVQVLVTLVCLFVARPLVHALGLSGAAPQTIYWLIIGAGFQVIAFSAILLLYYFDFRREALVSSFAQLAACLLLTAHVGNDSQLLGAGYALGCAVTTITSLVLLLRRLPNLLAHTFQSQPQITEA